MKTDPSLRAAIKCCESLEKDRLMMGEQQSAKMSRIGPKFQAFHNLMVPSANPAARQLMDTPSGAELKHRDVISGLQLVDAIRVPLMERSSRRERSVRGSVTQAKSPIVRLTASCVTGRFLDESSCSGVNWRMKESR